LNSWRWHGASALAWLAKDVTFDLVILDSNMPGMSSVQVLTELKSRQPPMEVSITTSFRDAE